jgi:hypothetical protein
MAGHDETPYLKAALEGVAEQYQQRVERALELGEDATGELFVAVMGAAALRGYELGFSAAVWAKETVDTFALQKHGDPWAEWDERYG